jgi:hypothetical protein
MKEDLVKGCLRPLLERVLLDRTLQFEFRGEYAEVYYRGGCITKVRRTPRSGEYLLEIDSQYFQGKPKTFHSAPKPAIVTQAVHCQEWLDAIGLLKDRMDLWFGVHQKWERDAQQLFARENNWDGTGSDSDYFIIDIEYQHPGETGRFDALAVHWPSKGSDRKDGRERQFAFIELKWRDGAVWSGNDANAPGIRKHVRDITRFVATKGFADVQKAMLEVVKDKRELGLLPEIARDIVSFRAGPPQLIMVLANHDPAKSKLRQELELLWEEGVSSTIQLRFARSNHFGYALFDDRLLTLEELLVELRLDESRHRAKR